MTAAVQTGVLRNCYKCGAEFQSDGSARICWTCRPKDRRKRAIDPRLSLRDKQVIALVVAGKLNKQIAGELHLSNGTVKEYLFTIFRKLRLGNRVELAVWAVRNPAEWAL